MEKVLLPHITSNSCVCCGRVDKALASTSGYWSLCFACETTIVRSAGCFWLNPVVIWLVRWCSAVEVECWVLKPCWWLTGVIFDVMWGRSIFSIVLAIGDSSDIGLYEVPSLGLCQVLELVWFLPVSRCVEYSLCLVLGLEYRLSIELLLVLGVLDALCLGCLGQWSLCLLCFWWLRRFECWWFALVLSLLWWVLLLFCQFSDWISSWRVWLR